ncbi:MAG: MmgE/PrpD family protein, partial [Burkholderiales bacterium]
MAKSVNVGNAARGGLYSALLAERGFTGSTRVIETERGFLECFGGDLDPSQLTIDLGATWELASNTYKPYPSGVVFHPIIDACLELRGRDGVRADHIESIVIRGHPLVMQRGHRPHPTTGLTGKLSVYYCAAVSIIRGSAGIREFVDDRVTAPDTQALQDRVSVIDDANIGKAESHVTLTLNDGRQYVAHVKHAVGSLGRPMSDQELEAKLRDLADYGRAGVAVEPLIDALRSFDRMTDAARLLTFTVPR